MWRTSIPLATYHFPRSPHVFCAFCPVLSVLLWTVLLGRHQGLWLCDLLSDGSHKQPLNLWLFLPIFLFSSISFLIMVQYRSSQYAFHLSAICAASVKFSPVADYCRRGWNFRVIDLTIWKTCLEFPFAFAASNSAHMPSSCCCLSILSIFCSSAFISW